jgi:WD40 repeat protein
VVLPGSDPSSSVDASAMLGGPAGTSATRRRWRPFGCVGCLGLIAVLAVSAWAVFRFAPLPVLAYVNPLPYFGQYHWVTHRGQTAINAIAFSPDGKRVASVGEENTLDVWDAATGHTDLSYSTAPNTIAAIVEWSPDGKEIAIGDSADALIVLDAGSGLRRFAVPGFAGTGSIAWSRDSKRVATADDGKVRVWSAADGALLTTFDAPTAHLVSWSPDGTRLAAGGQNGVVWVWAEADGQPLLTIPQQTIFDFTEWIAWSPDGARLAASVSTNRDSHLSVFDVPSGREVFTYWKSGSRVARLVGAWSPDSRLLAVGGTTDGKATIWNVSSGQKLRSYGGHRTFDLLMRADREASHRAVVEVLVWSSDGSRLATLGSDDSVQIWDPTDGRPIHVYDTESSYRRATPNGALAMAWSADNSRIAIGGDDLAEIWIPQ